MINPKIGADFAMRTRPAWLIYLILTACIGNAFTDSPIRHQDKKAIWSGEPKAGNGIGWSGILAPGASPILESPPNNPLSEVTNDSRFRGRIAYFTRLYYPKSYTRQLVQKGVGGYTATVEDEKQYIREARYQIFTFEYKLKWPPVFPSTIASYLSSWEEPLYGLDYSPDGLALLYGRGELGWSEGKEYYVWDFVNNRVDAINDKYVGGLPFMPWSPDSKHLASVVNTDESGAQMDPIHPVKLFSYNRSTQHTTQVADNIIMYNPIGREYQMVTQVSWTSRNTLLFTKIPPSSSREKVVHPAVYEVPADGGKTQMLASDAYYPKMSPDGKWLAVFGWAPSLAKDSETAKPKSPPAENTDSEDLRAPKSAPGVYLVNLATKERVLVRPLPLLRRRGDPDRGILMRWSPDSRGLVLVEITSYPGKGLKNEARISVVRVPPIVGKEASRPDSPPVILPEGQVTVTTLKASAFIIRDVSHDNGFLFLDTIDTNPEGYENSTLILQAVNLQDGTLTQVAKFENRHEGSTNGLAWHEDPLVGNDVKKH